MSRCDTVTHARRANQSRNVLRYQDLAVTRVNGVYQRVAVIQLCEVDQRREANHHTRVGCDELDFQWKETDQKTAVNHRIKVCRQMRAHQQVHSGPL